MLLLLLMFNASDPYIRFCNWYSTCCVWDHLASVAFRKLSILTPVKSIWSGSAPVVLCTALCEAPGECDTNKIIGVGKF